MAGSDPVAAWAASGAMALTGRPSGPPLLAPGRAALQVREQLAGLGFEIPGLLGERAAYAGLGRNGPWSCGGAFRVLPAEDGYVGLSLARESDVDLVPALVAESDSRPAEDPWSAVAGWLRATTAAEAEERIQLLGLPGGVVPTNPPADRPGVVVTTIGDRAVREQPLVVDLTSLWAGPLCAHLLGRLGARVIKVESTARPDGARSGPPAFFELLHAGHEAVRLDFTTERDQLRDLVASADLVLEASRPRALRQLGLDAADIVAGGTCWISITARGRDSDAVGFGDDVAAAAGLVVPDGGDLLPAGDALADPLAGVAAAVAAQAALTGEEAMLIDVSMLHVASEAATGGTPEHQVVRRRDGWWVEYAEGAVPVAPPMPRQADG
ncbi:CoA transferase [Nocardioides sp. NPDC057767]|uniref:CoA transferase n=1 Tax=Nocardioides panzhihuensis TaxID=860243 RepID=A0A7Z0ISU1_9ACTN|nr:CoA transferase [Nocardioides panzhihuensis]NYI78276.1 hypothetical protein [Nocardioides panzhihuensis]